MIDDCFGLDVLMVANMAVFCGVIIRMKMLVTGHTGRLPCAHNSIALYEEIRHLPIITSPQGASQICVTWYNFFAFRNKKECPHAAALVARRPPIAFTLL